MNSKYCNSLILTVLTVLILTISASDGDERPSFLDCVKNCVSKVCKLDKILKLTGWNCSDDCKYRCMRLDVDDLRKTGDKIVQYYGKWPFIRILGAQEIFSVIFSFGNLLACLYGYFFIYKKKSFDGSDGRIWYMKRVHLIGLLITCNAWLQSAIFHYRDTKITEKLDYFSACLFILSTVPTAVIRIFELKTWKQQSKIVIPMTVLYLQHVVYMSFVQFDYGYNVKFNAVFGVGSNLLWIYWALWKQNNKKIRRETIKFVGFNVISMLMVAVDFPPWFDLIDMHALWHLSTIPVTIMWYKFISIDNDKNK